MKNTFNVDLSKDTIEDRLEDFLKNEDYVSNCGYLAQKACEDMDEYFGSIPLLSSLSIKAAEVVIRTRANIAEDYLDEMKLLGEACGEQSKLIFGNLAYEMSKAMDLSCEWCSSISSEYKSGIIHARNLDWPLEGLEDITITVNYINGPAGDFKAVTFPGYVGVLTGVAKGRFSASINMTLDEDESISYTGNPVSLILREAFEICEDFETAKEFLLNADSFAPAMVHLVGTEPGENCIILVNDHRCKNHVQETEDDSLCITNHWDDDFQDSEGVDLEGEDWETDSVDRLEFANNNVGKVKSLKSAASLMRKSPLLNEETKHTVVMCAKTGHLDIL